MNSYRLTWNSIVRHCHIPHLGDGLLGDGIVDWFLWAQLQIFRDELQMCYIILTTFQCRNQGMIDNGLHPTAKGDIGSL